MGRVTYLRLFGDGFGKNSGLLRGKKISDQQLIYQRRRHAEGLCKVGGCKRKYFKKWLCEKHYLERKGVKEEIESEKLFS